METTLPTFTPLEGSLFLTLCGRALDNRSSQPILADKMAVIVADGPLAFLAQEEMISLLNRLTGHFPSGEVAFNGYSRFAIWAAKH